MKGAFEIGILLFFSMLMMVIIVGIIFIPVSYQQARHLQEIIVETIEHEDTYDQRIQQIIATKVKSPLPQTYNITPIENNRYQVSVFFPIKIPVLGIWIEGKVETITFPINR